MWDFKPKELFWIWKSDTFFLTSLGSFRYVHKFFAVSFRFVRLQSRVGSLLQSTIINISVICSQNLALLRGESDRIFLMLILFNKFTDYTLCSFIILLHLLFSNQALKPVNKANRNPSKFVQIFKQIHAYLVTCLHTCVCVCSWKYSIRWHHVSVNFLSWL